MEGFCEFYVCIFFKALHSLPMVKMTDVADKINALLVICGG